MVCISFFSLILGFSKRSKRRRRKHTNIFMALFRIRIIKRRRKYKTSESEVKSSEVDRHNGVMVVKEIAASMQSMCVCVNINENVICGAFGVKILWAYGYFRKYPINEMFFLFVSSTLHYLLGVEKSSINEPIALFH